jgi:putative FmdB family regulatory protein
MPIYAYKCSACGHALDVLQKITDAPMTVCPECGGAALAKQLTAAGFQLKGSGWYATDFRNGGTGAAKPEGPAAAKPADAAGGASASAAPAAASAPAAPAPASCGAGGCADCT